MSVRQKIKRLVNLVRSPRINDGAQDSGNRVKRLPPLFPLSSEKGLIALVQAGRFARVQREPRQLDDLEYGLFSQFGEDGIIEYLADRVPLQWRWFVEFGVDNYVESNTRLLLLRDYWKGLIIDGSSDNIDSIRNRPDFWRVNLRAEAAFITRENIESLIENHGFGGRPGVLSVDIDGNDYWVWEALKGLRPWIVVCEYNALFGPKADVSISYRADFNRMAAHPSCRYFGASLSALVRLGSSMGMRFVGVNRAGNNAFFVDPELRLDLPTLRSEEAFRETAFREARNMEGVLDFRCDWPDDPGFRRLPVFDFDKGKEVPLEDSIQPFESSDSA